MLTCTCSCNRGSSAWQTPRTSIAQTNFNFTKASISESNISGKYFEEDPLSCGQCLPWGLLLRPTLSVPSEVHHDHFWPGRENNKMSNIPADMWIMNHDHMLPIQSNLKGHKILMRRKAFHCCKVPCMKVIIFSQTRNYITWNHQIAYTCLFT